jgi:hypothetical protein
MTRWGSFDTIVMLGNNLGLLGGGPRLLRRLARLTSEHGRIVGETIEPSARTSGRTRIRNRYREWATPWLDYVLLPREELDELARKAGWRVLRTIDEPPFYVAVLDKET